MRWEADGKGMGREWEADGKGKGREWEGVGGELGMGFLQVVSLNSAGIPTVTSASCCDCSAYQIYYGSAKGILRY